MKLEELKRVIADTVVIYREHNSDLKNHEINFVDVYKGFLSNAPQNLLEEKVKLIGAKRKGIVDIEIY